MDAGHIFGLFADAVDRLAARIDAAVPVTICGELTEIRHSASNKNMSVSTLATPHNIKQKPKHPNLFASFLTFPSSSADTI
jgi:hypothetical protein